MDRPITSVIALAAALVAWMPRPAAAQFTCSTVARSGQNDPGGFTFVKRFTDLDINQGGDVVFLARASGVQPRLYLYPGVGAPSVVVTAGDVAPNALLYQKFAKAGLRALSINDAGDIAFWAKLGGGEGVFVRESGGSIEIAAASTNVSPGGGTFATFPSVSRLDSSPVAAFVATVQGGPDGIFQYDAGTNTLTAVVLEGDPTGTGREFCSFQAVGLGGGAVAFQALTQVDCTSLVEVPVSGLFLDEAGLITPIAAVGDASPIAGATYSGFLRRPDVNASHQVAYQAQVTGTLNVRANFHFDPPATQTKIAAGGDTAPSGGSLTRQAPQVLTDAGDTYQLWGTKLTTAKQGIFLYDASPASAVLSTDAPPTDQFAPGSSYKKLLEPRAPRDGSRLAFIGKVRDPVPPPSKVAVLRCVP